MRLADGTLISDWQRIVAEPPEVAYVEPLPDPAEVLALRVAESIADLKDALNTLPAPQVQVAAPDLSAIVQAVTSLNGPASAEDIAEAVARTLHVPEPESQQPLVDAIVKAFDKMDHRMQGMVPAFGASGPSNISDNPNRQLGVVSGTFWQATQPVSNDYLSNQVGTHVGVAGTLTSGTATGTGRCIGIRLFASGADASCTVTGVTGTITVRSGTGVDLNLLGTVTAPVVTWVSGTLDYLISGLS